MSPGPDFFFFFFFGVFFFFFGVLDRCDLSSVSSQSCFERFYPRGDFVIINIMFQYLQCETSWEEMNGRMGITKTKGPSMVVSSSCSIYLCFLLLITSY